MSSPKALWPKIIGKVSIMQKMWMYYAIPQIFFSIFCLYVSTSGGISGFFAWCFLSLLVSGAIIFSCIQIYLVFLLTTIKKQTRDFRVYKELQKLNNCLIFSACCQCIFIVPGLYLIPSLCFNSKYKKVPKA